MTDLRAISEHINTASRISAACREAHPMGRRNEPVPGRLSLCQSEIPTSEHGPAHSRISAEAMGRHQPPQMGAVAVFQEGCSAADEALMAWLGDNE